MDFGLGLVNNKWIGKIPRTEREPRKAVATNIKPKKVIIKKLAILFNN